MSGGEFRRVARIEQLRPLLEGRLELVERQRPQFPRERLVERRAFTAVQNRVVGEIGRGFGLVGANQLDERLLRHRLQRVIEHSLSADGGHGLLRDRLAAQRPGAVRRVDQRGVRQLQQLAVQGVEQHCAKLGRRPAKRGPEIGTADVADKQRVSGQHGHRGGPRRVVVHQERDRFDRMPRRFHSFDADAAEGDDAVVADRREGILRRRAA